MAHDIAKSIEEFPLLQQLMNKEPVFWANPNFDAKLADETVSRAAIFDATARLQRFRPYIETVFPETNHRRGSIESPLLRIRTMQQSLNNFWQMKALGHLYLKADNQLPVAGSIKGRGGVYAVLQIAEDIALHYSNLAYEDNYAMLSSNEFKQLFGHFEIVTTSNGNFSIAVATIARKLGFKVRVQLTGSAPWQQEKLTALGVQLVPEDTNLAENLGDHTYRIDCHRDPNLLLGFATAAIHLQMQLKNQQVTLDEQHPLFIYLPTISGQSAAGIITGLRQILQVPIYPIMIQSSFNPALLLELMTGPDPVSAAELNLDPKIMAASFAGEMPDSRALELAKTQVYGVATVSDHALLQYLNLLAMSENILCEPAALAGFAGYHQLLSQSPSHFDLEHATHIIWATGGSLVPKTDMAQWIQRGDQLLNPRLDEFIKF